MIERKPIKVPRTAIILPKRLKAQLKIWELTEETRDEDIEEIIDHYNMLVRKKLGYSGFTIVTYKNPKSHKNYVHFERVYEVCRMKGWDAKLYLESQFHRSDKWLRGKVKYPLPTMLYSVNAMRSFTIYLADIKQKYEKDTFKGKKERGKETRTTQTEVIQSIVDSIDMLKGYLKNTQHDNKEQYKVMKIYQYWTNFSPYYLWSIPWFKDVLPELEGSVADRYRTTFDMISRSKWLRTLIKEIAHATEEYYKVPPNIDLS